MKNKNEKWSSGGDGALSVTFYLIAGFLPPFRAAPQSGLIFPSWWEIFKLLARRGIATVNRSVKLSIVSAHQITAIRERGGRGRSGEGEGMGGERRGVEGGGRGRRACHTAAGN